jgi:hypothetical protein
LQTSFHTFTKLESDQPYQDAAVRKTSVYASDWLLATSAKRPGHPFSSVPLLQNPELLFRLKQKVTVESTTSLSVATGIPPHVGQLKMMKSLLDLCQTTLTKVNEHAEVVKTTIFEAMELRSFENGTVTRHQIEGILAEFRNGIRDDVALQIGQLQAIAGLAGQVGQKQASGVIPGKGRNVYTYHGRMWDVPKNFEFPQQVRRDIGWRLWLLGMPDYRTIGEDGVEKSSQIKPFKSLLPARMPNNIAKVFQNSWKPVFSMMMKGISTIPRLEELNNETIKDLYDLGTKYLETRVSYIFKNPRLHHHDWQISTWAKYMSRSVILKNGTLEDKALLPEETYLNKARPSGLKRKSRTDSIVTPSNIQRRRGPHSIVDPVDPEDPEDESDNPLNAVLGS